MSTLALIPMPFQKWRPLSQYTKRHKTMKKAYIHPRTEIISTVMTAPLALSDPQATVDPSQEGDPNEADARQDPYRYNVWDDDWTREGEEGHH